MYQMNLELRFPMDEQLLLPLDYTGCDTRTYSNNCITALNGSFLVTTGNGISWKREPTFTKLEVDELIVKKPVKSLVGTIKSMYSPKSLFSPWK